MTKSEQLAGGVVCKARLHRPSQTNPRYHSTTAYYSLDRTDRKALDTDEKQEINIDGGSAFYHQQEGSKS